MTESRSIAYLTGRYPAVSHTFVRDEIHQLRACGWTVHAFSIWRSADDQVLSEVDRLERERTVALLPPRFATARALLAGGRRLGLRSWLTLLRRAWRFNPGTSRGPLLALSWALEAVAIWQRCRQLGVRHLHAHLNGTAPAVASLVAHLGNENGGLPWTWSMTVHGPTEFYDVPRERLAAKVRDASAVICISDFARSQLMGIVASEHWSKLQVVRCGVAPDVFSPGQSKTAGERVRILSVGRLVSVKGHALLLEAAARLAASGRRIEVVIVGEGAERSYLQNLSRELGIDALVSWRGALGHDAVQAEYQAADVFCLSSFAEGIPIVLMEAMASEVPVLTTRLMGIPELVEDGRDGLLVAPGDGEDLSRALGRLVDDPELRERLGRAGREKVLRDYDAAANARQLSRSFELLLGAPGAAQPRSKGAIVSPPVSS
jgi:colanic acid/amylovoran biosynthesis glycosyltransferase